MTEVSSEQKLESKDILFIGAGRSAVCWYRVAVPAIFLGADWCGFDDNLDIGCGIVRGGTQYPDFNNYKVIIYQQPRSPKAMQLIRDLRKSGKKVLIDCDDYLHGVRKSKDHDFRNEKVFGVKELAKWERIMSNCDGLILSTEWLAKKYSKFNNKVWVCKNGLDLGRYDKTPPGHPGVNIGWAGATGHIMSFAPVLDAVAKIMSEYPYVNFISVGQNFAQALAERGVPSNRIIGIPWTSIELYPNAMMLFDIALAPARESNWYKAKSQLRHYEAAAAGACTLGSAWLYDEIIDGMTGFQIHSDEEWYTRMEELVTNHQMRQKMQKISRAVAWSDFDMAHRRTQWMHVLDEVAQTL